MPRSIPPFRYYFPDAEIDWLTSRFAEVLRNREFLTLGRYVEEFEAAFASYTGTRHAVAVSSGTAALEVILRHLGVEGREVIVPTNTFAATPFAVLHAGGRPVFTDCLDDLTVDPEDVERRIGPDTAAIMTVHIGGRISSATRDLELLARDRSLPLVEDAAHAHGSRLGGRHAGTFGCAAAFSFFTTKLMTTGEGGMIVTDDDHLRDRARLLRDQAKDSGRNLHRQVGNNWRMSEFQALLGLSQLRTLDTTLARRKEIVDHYQQLLAGEERLRPIPDPEDLLHNSYKYVLFVERGEPRVIERRLKELGVRLGGAVYERPCHLQPVFSDFSDGPLPRAERLCPSHICPPIYHEMDEAGVDYVVESLVRELS